MKPEQQKQIHIKLPYELHKKLRVQAAVAETTIQEYVVQALESRLGDKKVESPHE